jgi:outer membrane protein OmpA-like peptidoglycan-associated protein
MSYFLNLSGSMRPAFILLLLFPCLANGQNLLMNGSFEDENICTEYSKNCAAEGWISTSLTGDHYFHDPPNAFDGQHFIGLTFSKGLKRSFTNKFLRSRIRCSLRSGSVYNLEFYIRSVHGATDSIGIYFTGDDILFRRSPVSNEQPQLWVKDGIQETVAGKWQKVSLKYTASGKENFISIGDFRKNALDFTTMPDLGRNFYYFIDKIQLRPDNISELVCDDADIIQEEEYAFDPRHKMLDRYIYKYRKSTPPPLTPTSLTSILRIDTLVIPDVLFATDSFALNLKARKLLDSFITRFKGLRTDSIIVEGHTDSTGSLAWNKELSLNRAHSVVQYLQFHFETFFKARGWASEKPAAENRTHVGRQRNRRVEIYFYSRN